MTSGRDCPRSTWKPAVIEFAQGTCDNATRRMAASSESEVIAQQLSALGARIERVEARLGEVDPVIARLEGAALTTARAMQEISQHWDAVYEAMRRAEQPGDEQSTGLGRDRPQESSTTGQTSDSE